MDFYVEGLAFPDAGFSGLISLGVSLLDTSDPVGQARRNREGGAEAGWEVAGVGPGCLTPLLSPPLQELPDALLFQDSVAFRVAPWIMTPNTQPPQEVYVCR
jgi:protein-arginine deiminase